MDKHLLFVVGLTRSGTSLTYALLNQHPQIALMYEANALAPGEAGLSPQRLERMEFWNQALSRHGLSPAGLAGVRDVPGLYQQYAGEQRIHGEKTPAYCHRLEEMARVFPEARFLIVQRDLEETYRSVLQAGRRSRWFRKWGHFHRLLREQERMLQAALALRARGRAVYFLPYAGLVREPEAALRPVCAFLGLEYHPRMASLDHADLSAVEQRPEHGHLHARTIAARSYTQVLSPGRQRMARRFQNRWDRIYAKAQGPKASVATEREQDTEPSAQTADRLEPTALEWLFHQTLGEIVLRSNATARWLYEWLPLPMLRGYRAGKQLLSAREEAAEPMAGLGWALALPWLALALLCLVVIATTDALSPPHLVLGPWYLLPVAILTVKLGLRAGLLGSLLIALVWNVARTLAVGEAMSPSMFIWNETMRSCQLVIFSFLLAQRRPFASPGAPANGQQARERSLAAVHGTR